ncbi:hypothetical protein [Aquimarina algicola]|uniref:PKD domain-containing protein n=1 Tax=Aquimarina algicola TaxID=2589995 RepID=A0A504J6C0_9FLAO|nr:hypothetical protein [Aquimarina algicola]TPN82240.1 hypothetical protein FHK87_22715 [Aquimarina algicola]
MKSIHRLTLKNIAQILFITTMSIFISCDDEDSDLPGVGEIEDLTPPESVFSAFRSQTDLLTFDLKNDTRSAINFLWEVPDGVTVLNDAPSSTQTPLEARDLSVKFPDFGTYEITLTSSDNNNASSTVTQTVEITKPLVDAPEPNFSFELKESDFRILDFTNESQKTARVIWVLPTGASLYDADPSDDVTPSLEDDNVKIRFPDEGTYDVTLKAFNIVDNEAEITKTVEVSASVAPTPVILEPGFDKGNDSRGAWEDKTYLSFDLGGIIQITTDPVQDGTNAAKLPDDGSRVGYQEIAVTPNTDYTLTYYYTIKTSPAGSVTVSIVGGTGFTSEAEVNAAIIATDTGNDQTNADSFTRVNLSFNSGSNSTVAIYFTNTGAEARVDSFSIAVDN